MRKSDPPSALSLERHNQILREVTLLIAENGIRGTTLRKAGDRAGMNFTWLASLYGGKDALIAACFAGAVERDLARLHSLLNEHASMEMGTTMIAPLLWSLCEEAAGRYRIDSLLLVELILAAARPELSEIFRSWISRRHEALRTLADRVGLNPLAFDVLGLAILAETAFAISNATSLSYRLVARAGVEEAFARLTGTGDVRFNRELRRLISRYHLGLGEFPMPPSMDADVEGKNQIINAAIKLIEEKGIDGVTNRAVAREAGVSLALTSYHFRSIHELTLAALRRIAENLAVGLESPVADPEMRATLRKARRSPADPPKRDLMFHRGTLQLALAAARSESESRLGQIVRRQLGLSSYAAIMSEKGRANMRTCATSYSLWAAAAFLVAPALGPTGRWFDFDAQARLAKNRLLGIG